jgi:DNA polymerase-3 subunit delta'
MTDVLQNPLPRWNPELVGQEAAERVLVDGWTSGRLPHAWLFTGPRGIGKATLAYRFARFVLANGGEGNLLHAGQPQTLALDPENPVFRRAAAGGHPDLLSLQGGDIHPDTGRATDGIVVAQVRRAVGFMRLTPAMGGWRVAVIDAADSMNTNAANALLKSLEEPPKRALFLLISHAPGALLPTIRSRCQRLLLVPLEDTQVSELLKRYRPECTDADRALVLHLADGSIGEALAIADAGGLDLYREFVRILGTLPDLDIPAAHALGDRMARGSAAESFATFARLVDCWLSGMIRSVSTGRPGFEAVDGEQATIERLAGLAGLEEWLAVWDKVKHLLSRAEVANLDRKQVVIGMFQTLASTSG